MQKPLDIDMLAEELIHTAYNFCGKAPYLSRDEAKDRIINILNRLRKETLEEAAAEVEKIHTRKENVIYEECYSGYCDCKEIATEIRRLGG